MAHAENQRLTVLHIAAPGENSPGQRRAPRGKFPLCHLVGSELKAHHEQRCRLSGIGDEAW